MTEPGSRFVKLVAIMERLLGPDGCPWDRKQTLESLRPFTIEEAFEVVDAIDRGDMPGLREELGDLLLQVVFQAALANQQGEFDVDSVVDAICDKLTRRHPWVFGGEKASDASGALKQWEEIKAQERAEREARGGKRDEGALGGVPVSLPALLRAQRIGEKAARFGYDFRDGDEVRSKVDEELAELDLALEAGDSQRAGEELGDVLFAMVSLGRKHGVDAESALRGTLDRFSRRFREAERIATEEGRGLGQRDADELDRLWERAKRAAGSE